jgi:chromosomal replication initiation ATPase DnaA
MARSIGSLAANQLTKEPITVALAERTLADLVRAREARRVRIEDILDRLAPLQGAAQ